jgi:hypothetical protein
MSAPRLLSTRQGDVDCGLGPVPREEPLRLSTSGRIVRAEEQINRLRPDAADEGAECDGWPVIDWVEALASVEAGHDGC